MQSAQQLHDGRMVCLLVLVLVLEWIDILNIQKAYSIVGSNLSFEFTNFLRKNTLQLCKQTGKWQMSTGNVI